VTDGSEEILSADDDEWVLAEGEVDGYPSIFRFRPGLSKVIGHPSYPRRLVVTWEYGDDGEHGLPSSEQTEAMQSFETTLVDSLDPDWSHLASCLDGVEYDESDGNQFPDSHTGLGSDGDKSGSLMYRWLIVLGIACGIIVLLIIFRR